MCFRPAAVSLPKTCPECGFVNEGEATVCAECGAELPEDAMPGLGAPGTPGGAAGAPPIPGAPGAPSAPGAPAAPGAPKAPGA